MICFIKASAIMFCGDPMKKARLVKEFWNERAAHIDWIYKFGEPGHQADICAECGSKKTKAPHDMVFTDDSHE